MLFIKFYHHLNHFIKSWESKFIIKNANSSWGLILFNSQFLQLIQSKQICPPISFISAAIFSCLIPSAELRKIFDICNSSQERVMHNKKSFLFCVNNIKFNKICTLIQCSLKSLQSIFRENRSQSSMSYIQWPISFMNVWSRVRQAIDNIENNQREGYAFMHHKNKLITNIQLMYDIPLQSFTSKQLLKKILMDIEFVEEQYRDDIFKLMELCSIDLSEAYQLYMNGGNNFQSAVQMHFNKGEPKLNENIPKYEAQQVYESKAPAFIPEDFDDLYQRYVAHKQSGLTLSDKYEIRKDNEGLMGYVTSIFKKVPQNQFKKKLEEYIGKSCSVKFCLKSVSQGIQQACWKEKFPLIVHCLNFQSQVRNELTALYRDELLVDMLNVQFRNYGLDTKNYDLELDMKQFINIKQENYFVILRVNILDEIQVLQKFKFTGMTAKQIIKKLKLIKNICINREMDEAHVERRLREQMMGNYNYKKPTSIAEKQKIAKDRAIRKKQEEEFYQTMKKQQQKQQIKKKQEEINQESGQKQNQSKDNQKEATLKKHQEISKKKQMIRKKLKIFDDGMMIKLRVPSGNSIKVIVGHNEKIQYLYDYIFSLDQDLGFEDEVQRKFNIIRPYDQLNLTEHLDKTYQVLFESSDMESLIVNQQ